jgi:hypothetical protein
VVDGLLGYLTADERAHVAGLLAATAKPWTPLPGPQTQGYVSEATIVGFGGAAGGGKSAQAVGLALTRHQRVAIFRQNGTELVGIVDYIADVLGNRDGYALPSRGAGAVCSRGGNAASWGRGSVRAGGCGRVDRVARRGHDQAGGSRGGPGPVLELPTRFLSRLLGCTLILRFSELWRASFF